MNTALAQITNQTLGTLASLPTRATAPSLQPKSQVNNVANPHPGAWERKWIGLDCYHPAIERMATEARKFCARWSNNNPHPSLLVLAGHTGCGKTHTINAIHRYARGSTHNAWESGKWGNSIPSIDLIRWPSAVDALRKNDDRWLQDAFSVGLLALDEIGGADDPWQNGTDKLCQILSRRENKFTVVTTNIEPAAWEQKFDVRIADRFLRNSVIVDLSQVQSYALNS